MNKIKIMTENLANKIAAGEVVEKCSSVVKELVENSIDASSSIIKIELKDGGLSLIKITDNGTGMEHDDALLAFSRHATSKLLNEDDLFFINTLGFRGEALPSIAAVSEVTLKTCASNIGTEIVIKGGKIIKDNLSDARKGTSISIENLFYNTPARLKFLKSITTELNNIVSLVERLSLSYPNIKFSLFNNENKILDTSGSGDLLKTIHEIYGTTISSKMIYIHNMNDDYEIDGYICKPEILKSNRNHMITFVNGRVVKNIELNKMINDAYYTYKPDIKYPVVVINVLTDPTLIDVNIHPTKQDIKFSKIDSLSDLVIKTIKEALYNNLLIKNVEFSNPSEETEEDIPQIEEKNYVLDLNQPKVEESQVNFEFEEPKKVGDKNEDLKTLELYPIGLALGTYIICQNNEGIYLIDQHAAEERINYEKYLKALKDKEVSVITPLIPITLELSKSEFLTIQDNINLLDNMGFKIVEFGINTYKIVSHPTWLKEGFETESIHKIFDLIINIGSSFDPVKFNEHIAITLACKLSIKANYNITIEEMEYIVKNLVKCDNPYNCPHGRPTIITFTIYELEKMFKRVMN